MTEGLFPVPFPDREHHTDPCPGCEHPLGIHASDIGCVFGWTYSPEGYAVTEGCECPLTLSQENSPPTEKEV